MNRETFSLRNEPLGPLYKRLIRIATLETSHAYLITQTDPVSESVRNALAVLEKEEVRRRKVREWPGTVLSGSRSATLHEYSCTRNLANALTRLANGLYDWIEPNLPEDLGFLRSDGSAWLASIAHERDAFFELSRLELERLLNREPHLNSLVVLGDVTESTQQGNVKD